MRRYLPALLAAFGTAAVTAAAMGGGFAAGQLLTLLVVFGLPMLLSWASGRRRPKSDPGWRGGDLSFVPSAGHPPVGRGAVAVALGRVEARELVVSASFGAGIGLAIINVLLIGFEWADDSGGDLARTAQIIAVVVHPLVGMAMLAAFRARTRGRRDDLEELFASCPTSLSTRTMGHLTTGWVAAACALLTAALLMVGIVTSTELVYGSVGGRQVTEVLVVAVLGCGAVALGNLLARLLPWSVVPVAALVGLAFATAALASSGRATNPVRQLSTWLGDFGLDLRFTAPHFYERLGWLVSLAAMVAVLAVLRDLRRPAVVGLLAVAAVGAVVTGVAATRPIDAADAERIAAMLADPISAQECRAVGPIDICAYPDEDRLRDRFIEEVAPVVAAVPVEFPTFVLRYAASGAMDRRELDPEVLALLPTRVEEPTTIPFEMRGVDGSLEAARIWVGLAATGLLEDMRRVSAVGVNGQARGVIALWLATRGADASTTRDLTSFVADPRDGQADHRPWPDPCYGGVAPVRWAGADVAAARALTELPEGDVARVLAADWEHLIDPSTSTHELLLAVGLEPIVDPTQSTRVGEC